MINVKIENGHIEQTMQGTHEELYNEIISGSLLLIDDITNGDKEELNDVLDFAIEVFKTAKKNGLNSVVSQKEE